MQVFQEMAGFQQLAKYCIVAGVHIECCKKEARDMRTSCQAEPEGGSRGLIYIEIGTEIIEGLRG